MREIDVVGQIVANYMSDGKPFIAGDNLTFTDFSYFELLDFMNHYSKGDTFAKYPKLHNHHNRITSLPSFSKAWTDDKVLMKEPFKYGKMAAMSLRI